MSDSHILPAALSDLSSVLDSIDDAIAYHSQDGTLVWANQAYLQTKVFPTDQDVELDGIEGRDCYEVMGLAGPCTYCPIRQAIQAGEVCQVELSAENQPEWPESVGTWLVKAVPIRDDQGEMVGAIEIARNVTEQRRAERRVADREAVLSDILESTLSGYWDWDIPGHTEYLSPAFKEMFGYQDHELENSPDSWQELIFAEDLPGVMEVFDRHVRTQGREPFHNEVRYRHKDGSTVWVICAGRVIEWAEDGSPLRMVGCHVDITDRKQMEEALLDSRMRQSLAASSAGIGIWDWNVVTDEMTWDDQMFRLYGLDKPQDDYGVEIWADGLHPEDRQFAWDACQAAVRGEGEYDIEFRVQWPDGTVRWIKGDGAVIRDDSGKAVRMLGTNYDITDRKGNEQEIRALETRNRALLDHSPVCHKIVDLDLKLRYMNANGFKMLGLEENEELYGKPYPFDFFPQSSREKLTEELDYVRDTGLRISFEAPACDSRGNEVWLYHTLIPVRDENDQIAFITVVSADVTEQRKMQDRLRHSEKMDAIGHLAGGVAHDFNNQLTGVLGYADMLIKKLDDPELRACAENIYAAARRSSDLTKKLLAFSRKGQFRSVPVNIHKVIEETVDMLSHSLDKRIRIRQPLEASEATAMGDPSQLQNALLNLGVNARDAMSDGGTLTFATDTVDLDEAFCQEQGCQVHPGRYVVVSIMDTGAGIPADVLPHVFEPFYTTKAEGQGTGMGLASVYGTVSQHQGCVTIDSTEGKGTCVKVYLPLTAEAEAIPAKPTAPAGPAESLCVLVVEDEEIVRRFVSKILTTEGYQVRQAANGQEGVELYRESWQEIDLVVLDMIMPVMDGKEAFMAMKQINPEIKALISSGYSVDTRSQAALAEGLLGVLQKPFDVRELLTAIREGVAAG